MSEKFKPLSDADWPVEIAGMMDGFAGGLNVYRVMAHHPMLLRAWAGLRDHIVHHRADCSDGGHRRRACESGRCPDRSRLPYPPPARTELEQHLGPQGVLDVIATVGFYSTLAYIVKSFNVPIDAHITGISSPRR